MFQYVGEQFVACSTAFEDSSFSFVGTYDTAYGCTYVQYIFDTLVRLFGMIAFPKARVVFLGRVAVAHQLGISTSEHARSLC